MFHSQRFASWRRHRAKLTFPHPTIRPLCRRQVFTIFAIHCPFFALAIACEAAKSSIFALLRSFGIAVRSKLGKNICMMHYLHDAARVGDLAKVQAPHGQSGAGFQQRFNRQYAFAHGSVEKGTKMWENCFWRTKHVRCQRPAQTEHPCTCGGREAREVAAVAGQWGRRQCQRL